RAGLPPGTKTAPGARTRPGTNTLHRKPELPLTPAWPRRPKPPWSAGLVAAEHLQAEADDSDQSQRHTAEMDCAHANQMKQRIGTRPGGKWVDVTMHQAVQQRVRCSPDQSACQDSQGRE